MTIGQALWIILPVSVSVAVALWILFFKWKNPYNLKAPFWAVMIVFAGAFFSICLIVFYELNHVSWRW